MLAGRPFRGAVVNRCQVHAKNQGKRPASPPLKHAPNKESHLPHGDKLQSVTIQENKLLITIINSVEHRE